MRLFIYYLFVINFLTFVIYGFDKYQAKKKKRRISENTLHVFALLGGSLAAFIAQRVYRHKTVKRPFIFLYWAIVIIQILLFVYLIKLR